MNSRHFYLLSSRLLDKKLKPMCKQRAFKDIVLAILVTLVLVACGGAVGWREFRSNEGGFSIMMPGRPEEQSQKTATAFGTIESRVFLVEYKGAGYLLNYADYPPEIVQDSPEDVILDGVSLGVVAQSGGTLISSAAIRLGEYTGRELEINSPAGGSVLMVRIYLVGTRIFQLSVVSELRVNNSEDLAQFFNSFELLES
jgi:hypothetical protein